MTGTSSTGALAGWTISLDLWGTLITYGDREAEAAWRIREFATVIAEFGHTVSAERIRSAVQEMRERTLQRQRAIGTQPAPREQVAEVTAALGIAGDELVDILLVAHTHAVLRAFPDLIPGALGALEQLRTVSGRLVLTSNTLATPSGVIRQILDGHGLTGFFDDMVFSGDLGVAKPRPEVFHAAADRSATTPARVVHVGNDWRTDILGALQAGCRAIWFNPRRKPPRPQAPSIQRLSDLPEAITAACGATPMSPTTMGDSR